MAIVTITVVAGLVSGVALIVMRPVGVIGSMIAPAAAATGTVRRSLTADVKRSAPATQPARSGKRAQDRPPAAISHNRPTAAIGEPAPMAEFTRPADKTNMNAQIVDAPALPSLPASGAPLASTPGDQLAQPMAPPDAAQSGGVTPWGAAADTGVAVARGSQRAAVATAGFFSRLGQKVAKSF
jgi:hypothetical protein